MNANSLLKTSVVLIALGLIGVGFLAWIGASREPSSAEALIVVMSASFWVFGLALLVAVVFGGGESGGADDG